LRRNVFAVSVREDRPHPGSHDRLLLGRHHPMQIPHEMHPAPLPRRAHELLCHSSFQT